MLPHLPSLPQMPPVMRRQQRESLAQAEFEGPGGTLHLDTRQIQAIGFHHQREQLIVIREELRDHFVLAMSCGRERR